MGHYLELLLAGRVFMVGQSLTATAVNGAQFVLFNPVGSNRVLYVFQADFSVAAAMEVDVFTLTANPGLALGNSPGNANPTSPNALAQFQAAVAARPATHKQISASQTAPGGPIPTPLDEPIRLAAGFGLLISSAAVAGVVSLTLGWIEQGPDSDTPES